MWYFTWILGVGFAAAFAVINAMWLESVCDIVTQASTHPATPSAPTELETRKGLGLFRNQA